MNRHALLAAAIVAACNQAPGAAELTPAQPCERAALTGDLAPAVCQTAAGGQILRLTYTELVEGDGGGVIGVDVLDAGGRRLQSFRESGVSGYWPPEVTDVDGDGRADLLLTRAGGTANAAQAVWVFGGAGYRRVGEVNGVSVERTDEGYIAVPARSSASAWDVTFYELDEEALRLLLAVAVEAQGADAAGQATGIACRISDAPGLARLELTLAEAQEKFCAEPAAQVFR